MAKEGSRLQEKYLKDLGVRNVPTERPWPDTSRGKGRMNRWIARLKCQKSAADGGIQDGSENRLSASSEVIPFLSSNAECLLDEAALEEGAENENAHGPAAETKRKEEEEEASKKNKAETDASAAAAHPETHIHANKSTHFNPHEHDIKSESRNISTGSTLRQRELHLQPVKSKLHGVAHLTWYIYESVHVNTCACMFKYVIYSTHFHKATFNYNTTFLTLLFHSAP